MTTESLPSNILCSIHHVISLKITIKYKLMSFNSFKLLQKLQKGVISPQKIVFTLTLNVGIYFCDFVFEV